MSVKEDPVCSKLCCNSESSRAPQGDSTCMTRFVEPNFSRVSLNVKPTTACLSETKNPGITLCHNFLPRCDFSRTFPPRFPTRFPQDFSRSFLALLLPRDAPGSTMGGRKVVTRPHKSVHGKVLESRFPCLQVCVTSDQKAAASTNVGAPLTFIKQNYDQRRARRRSTHRDSQQPSADLAHQAASAPSIPAA